MTSYEEYLGQMKDASFELDLLREQANFLNDLFISHHLYNSGHMSKEVLIEQINHLSNRIKAQRDTVHLLY